MVRMRNALENCKNPEIRVMGKRVVVLGSAFSRRAFCQSSVEEKVRFES